MLDLSDRTNDCLDRLYSLSPHHHLTGLNITWEGENVRIPASGCDYTGLFGAGWYDLKRGWSNTPLDCEPQIKKLPAAVGSIGLSHKGK